MAWVLLWKGCSSIGRASVSKTEGWGFATLHPCHLKPPRRKGRRRCGSTDQMVDLKHGCLTRYPVAGKGRRPEKMSRGDGKIQSIPVHPRGAPRGRKGYLAVAQGGVGDHA